MDSIEVATVRSLQKISAHTSRSLKRVTDELHKFSPKNQLNLKLALLRQLPKKPLKMDIYMEIVKYYLLNNEVQLTVAEYEILLNRLGVVKRDKVCVEYNRELVETVLLIL